MTIGFKPNADGSAAIQTQGVDRISITSTGEVVIPSLVGTIDNGAIIESDSNANGSYTKFADGTAIARVDTTYVGNIGTAFGALFRSGSTVGGGTLPITFSSTPTFSTEVIVNSGAANPFVVGSSAGTSSVIPLYLLVDIATRTGLICTMTTRAIGRWKP